MNNLNPLLMCDGYKTNHRKMYPLNTSMVYSNYTCRSIKYMPEKAQDIVVFGVQYTFKYIRDLFNINFFFKNKEEVCQEAKRYLTSYLGMDYDVSHFEALHDLGYLPIEVKSLKEGSIISSGIPLFTIQNTHPDFFWITNFLETLISTLIWKPVHSASLAYAYRKMLTKYAKETGMPLEFVDFQAHDFSFRGMQSPESAVSSGLGFLTCFKGTDTLPTLQSAKYYYNEDLAGFSVPASEHSVMCSHGKEGEIETLKYLMNQYPTGILSVVSDTWDLWKLVTNYLKQIKQDILNRDGKLVIRPDSGDPVDIICGKSRELVSYDSPISHTEIHKQKGVVELLWDIFGGTINEQGYKVLDSHIGVIYGDSITLERAEQIAERLKAKGFANQVVLGVGSYSLGYATRDNQGGAVKSTAVVVNNELREIYKDPITDDGTKKSAKGLLQVYKENNVFKLKDQCSLEEESKGELQTIFFNGNFVKTTSLDEIRTNILSTL